MDGSLMQINALNILNTGRQKDILFASGLFAFSAFLAITVINLQSITYDIDGQMRDAKFWAGVDTVYADGETEDIPIQIPGPLDVWAGSESKTLKITSPFGGKVTVDLSFMESHESKPPLLSFLVEDKEVGRYQSLKGAGTPRLQWKAEETLFSHQEVIDLPQGWTGKQIITIKTVEGSWIVFRSITIRNTPDRWLVWLLRISTGIFIVCLILLIIAPSDKTSVEMPNERAGEETNDLALRHAVIAVALSLILTGLLVNRWAVSAMIPMERLEQGGVIYLLLFQVGVICLGILIFSFRQKAIVIRTIGKMGSFLGPSAGFIIICLFSYLAAETISAFAFAYIIPKENRIAALKSAGAIPNKTQASIPHLWSNYRPNPEAGAANEYGWRWGGGPKRSATRILCIGGSTTWSPSVLFAKSSYPAQLEIYLRKQGYDVDVINAGVYYYSSMEELTTLAFRGLHEKPDIVIIHSGINDVEPMLSPVDYRPDYSHWRSARSEYGAPSSNRRYQHLWGIPSWTVRLVSLIALRPDGSSSVNVSSQAFGLVEAVRSDHPIKETHTSGFETNLANMVAMTHSVGAIPILVDFEIQYEHFSNDNVYFRGLSEEKKSTAIKRWKKGVSMVNSTINKVARENNARLLPFSRFTPLSPRDWVDSCHLSENGCRGKAKFFGDYLIEWKLLGNRSGKEN